MRDYLEPCSKATCGHRSCAQARTFQQFEKSHDVKLDLGTKLEAIYAEKCKEEDVLRSDFELLKRNYAEAKTRQQDLEESNQGLEQTVTLLNSEVARLNVESKRQTASYLSETLILREEIRKLKGELVTVTNEKEGLFRSEAELKKENASCISHNEVLKEDNAKLQSEVEGLKSQGHDLQNTIERLQQDKSSLESETKVLGELLMESKAQREALNTSLREWKTKNAALVEEIKQSKLEEKVRKEKLTLTLMDIQTAVARSMIHGGLVYFDEEGLDSGATTTQLGRYEGAVKHSPLQSPLPPSDLNLSDQASVNGGSHINSQLSEATYGDREEGELPMSPADLGGFQQQPPRCPRNMRKRRISEHHQGTMRNLTWQRSDSYRPVY